MSKFKALQLSSNIKQAEEYRFSDFFLEGGGILDRAFLPEIFGGKIRKIAYLMYLMEKKILPKRTGKGRFKGKAGLSVHQSGIYGHNWPGTTVFASCVLPGVKGGAYETRSFFFFSDFGLSGSRTCG
jgi:hypothetical protein